MQNQIDAFLQYVSIDDIYIVVGFKKELIMEVVPQAAFIYNDYFDTTNTSQSLLRALRKVGDRSNPGSHVAKNFGRQRNQLVGG